MDPHSFYLLDPDPGGTIFQIKTEKGKEIANTVTAILFNFLSKFAKSSIVSYFKIFCILRLQKTLHEFIFYKIC